MDHESPFPIHALGAEAAAIETALLDLDLLKEAVVVAQQCRSGRQRLVAYVVPAGQPGPTPAELRAALGRRLGDHALPDAIVLLEALPRLPGGGVNQAALPTPYAARPELGNPYQRPRDPLEQLLAEIWEDCLNVRPVGVFDHFFELGGDSLLAVQMLTAVEEAVGKKLPAEALLSGSTVEFLAGELLKPQTDEAPAQLTAVQAGGPRRRLFFLHGDFSGGGLYCLNLARHLGRGHGFYALPPHTLLVPQTIEEMAADHLRTLIDFQRDGPYILGGYCNGALVALEMAHRLHRLGQHVELLVLIDPPRPPLGQPIPYIQSVLQGTGGVQAPRLGLHQLPPEQVRTFLGVIYWRACGRYQLRPYPGRLAVIESAEDGPKVNWREVAPEVVMASAPGNHVTMLTRHVEELAAVLRPLLARPEALSA